MSSSKQLNGFERLPLFGKRIAITRRPEQAGALREQLTALGAEVIEVPTIEIRDPASWEPLDSAIRRLEEFDYLLVTSANGVRNFLRRLEACGRDVRDLKGLIIGAIGPATAAEFAKTGVKVDIVPREYIAEGLLEALGNRDLSGKAFLIPRAKVARDVVPRVLTERGGRVEVVEAYEIVVPEFPAGRIAAPPFPAPGCHYLHQLINRRQFRQARGRKQCLRIVARSRHRLNWSDHLADDQEAGTCSDH